MFSAEIHCLVDVFDRIFVIEPALLMLMADKTLYDVYGQLFLT
jgi:hypothetical protein